LAFTASSLLDVQYKRQSAEWPRELRSICTERDRERNRGLAAFAKEWSK